jgi:hypothetical protein
LGKCLRILSANLMNGGACSEAFAAMVAALDVDLLAVQEVGYEQAGPLAELFDHGQIDPADNYVGMGLMCRYPVSLERVEMTWGFGQTVRLEAGDGNELSRPIEVTNLHVAAPHMLSPLPGPYLRWRQASELDAYLKRADGRDELQVPGVDAQSRNESKSNNKATNVSAGQGSPTRPGSERKNSPARLLVGDFNATPYWPWYRRMASQFTDAAVTVADKAGTSPKPTWGPWPGAPKLLRIDHGFLRGLEVQEFEVFEIEGSDHSALVMDITLPV